MLLIFVGREVEAHAKTPRSKREKRRLTPRRKDAKGKEEAHAKTYSVDERLKNTNLAIDFSWSRVGNASQLRIISFLLSQILDADESFVGIAETVEFQAAPFHKAQKQATHPTVWSV